MLVIYHQKWIDQLKQTISFLIINALILVIVINHYHNEIFTYLINTLSYNFNISQPIEDKRIYSIHENIYIYSQTNDFDIKTQGLWCNDSNDIVFDLVPAFEFNLDLNNTTDLYFSIQLLTLLFCIIPYISYIFLHFFRNIYIHKYVIQYLLIYWLSSITINYFILIPLLFNLVFHNYLEYLYFEFNLGVDLSKYIITYYKTLFMTYLILNVLHFHEINKDLFYNINLIRAFYVITIFWMFSNNYILYIFFTVMTVMLFELKNIYKIILWL